MGFLKDIGQRLEDLKTSKYGYPFIILLAVGILILAGSRSLLRDSNNKSGDKAPTTVYHISTNTENNLENQIERILSQIRGVGKVSVLVTYESGKEIIPAVNTVEKTTITEERDNQGGTRTINQKELNNQTVIVREGGIENPIVLKEINPKIKGVLVVAEGAANPDIKMEIFRVIQSVLDLSAYRIQVLPMKN